MNIKTTAETIAEIKAIIEQNPEEGRAVRIYLAGMGCGGPAFGLALDEPNDDDLTYTQDEQVFLMQPEFHEQFGDFRVEFTDEGYIVQPLDPSVLPASACGSCSGC